MINSDKSKQQSQKTGKRPRIHDMLTYDKPGLKNMLRIGSGHDLQKLNVSPKISAERNNYMVGKGMLQILLKFGI
jgi:hypothetical protein